MYKDSRQIPTFVLELHCHKGRIHSYNKFVNNFK